MQRQARPDIPAVEEDSFALDDLRQSPVRFDAQGHERKAFGRADIGGAEAQRLYHEWLATDISPANAGVLSVVTPDGDHYVEDLPACQRAELAMSLSGGTVTLERGRHVAGRNKYGAETAKKGRKARDEKEPARYGRGNGKKGQEGADPSVEG